MSTFIEFADPIARIAMQAMLNSIWQGALITAVVFGLVKLLRRTNAATRYAMWMVTLTAVFCLFILNVWNTGGGHDLFSIVKLNEETQQPVGEMNPDLNQFSQVISPAEKQEGTSVPEAENAESLLMTGSEMTSESTAPNNYQIHLAPEVWHLIVFCAWILITLFLLLRLIHSYFYSLHIKRSARHLPAKHQKMLGLWIYTQKIKRTIRICSSQQVTTPVAIGLFNPVVLIPESLLNKLSEAELKHVIAHELAHLQRRDDWTNLLQKIIETFLIFHPAVLFLKNRLNLEREIACDDSVVATLGAQRAYTACLIRLAELIPFSTKPALTSGALDTKKQIFKRIEALMQTNRKFKIGISLIGICGVIILITIGVYYFTKISPLVALKDRHYAEEIIDGVRYVHNYKPQWGDEPRVELEFVKKVGILNKEDEDRFVYLHYAPNDIAKDEDGNIYVLDNGNYRIWKYNNLVEFKTIIGYEDESMREIMKSRLYDFEKHGNVYHNFIDIDNDGNIYVGESMNRSLKVLSSKGEEIRDVILEKGTNFARLSDSGEIINTRFYYNKQGASSYRILPNYMSPILQVYNSEGVFIRDFVVPTEYKLNDEYLLKLLKLHNISDEAISEKYDRRFVSQGNNLLHTFDSQNNVYVVFETQNRIEKYTLEGDQVYSMSRKLKYEVVEKSSYFGLRTTPVSTGIGVDGKDRLWVLTHAKQSIRENRKNIYFWELEIYDRDGILLGKTPFPDTGRIIGIRIYDDLMYFIMPKEVLEYKIIEK